MPVYQAVVLAVVQALTEFLPISSSAHLALAPWLLGWPDQGLAFDIALHFGTLLAVVAFFHRDLARILGRGLGLLKPGPADHHMNGRMLWFLAAATIPVGVAGLLLKPFVETTLRSPYVMGTMLVAVGLLMWYAEAACRQRRSFGEIELKDALWIGLAQAVALIPGTSRSGITITAAMLRSIDRPSAARFSFLLSTPAVLAAALKDFWDLQQAGGLSDEMKLPFAAGIGVSALTGFAVIALFLRYLRSNTLRFFIAYRIVFGIIIIALAIFRR
jgi:undecaprenyl-diphosphatase